MEDRVGVLALQHGGTTSIKEKVCAWGEAVSVTATAKEGYVFLGWDSDREGIEGTETTITFTMPQAPVTLVANFFPKALLEGWMDTRIDAKVDGDNLLTKEQAAEKTSVAIREKVANKELITSESLQELALGTPVIEVAEGKAKVGIELQKASELGSGTWQKVKGEEASIAEDGTLQVKVPAGEKAAFYKFVVPVKQN